MPQTLESLADLELEARNARSIERRFRLSRLQAQHSIDSFNFKHHKSRLRSKTRILRLLDLDFLQQGHQRRSSSAIPAWAKPFWPKSSPGAPARPISACCSPPPWTCSIICSASQVDHSLIRKLKIYTEPTLLVCDELGYLSLDQQTSNLFYQVISTRHSHKRSTIITTNTAFSDWGNILYNTTIATAIADRLVENSEIFLLGGDSLRKANKNPNPPAE